MLLFNVMAVHFVFYALDLEGGGLDVLGALFKY